MPLRRQLRELLKRLGIDDPNAGDLALPRTLAPTMVAWDASGLTTPPLLKVYGVQNTAAAVAAQRAMISLAPQTKPILLLDCRPNNDCTIGVVNSESPALGNTATPEQLSGLPIESADATVKHGTSATDPFTSSTPTRLRQSVLHELGLIVVPGFFFYFRGTADNTNLTLDHFSFVEIPDTDWRQSGPLV